MQTRQNRWWDLPTALFFCAALFTAAIRLQTTNWTDHLVLTQMAVFTGAILGMALGYSKFKARTSFLFGLVFTIIFPIWILGSLFNGEWLYRLDRMGLRLGGAASQLLANQAVKDPILFVAGMLLIFWFIAFLGGYHLIRYGRPWVVLVITSLLVLAVDYSFDMFGADDPGPVFSILFFLLLLLLFARLNYLNSRKEWDHSGQMVESEVGGDLGRGAAIAAIVVLFIAWTSPRVVKAFTPGTPEQIKVAEEFRAWRERISNAVSSLQSPAPLIVETFSDSLSLGRGSVLSEEVVFTVKLLGPRSAFQRFYWTGRTYDTFLGDKWAAVDETRFSLGPGAEPAEYSWENRREVTIDIFNRIAYLGTLYYVNAPITISRPVQALQGPTTPDGPDITGLEITPPLVSGENYRVLVDLVIPSVRDMRISATEVYPEWVTDRYLQLPPEFPDSIRVLAETITAGKVTAYDKTLAVTQYLRDNITYSTTIPQPPADQDVMEWFLLEYKSGFCNYYATAEVLMLRSLGIPARMSIGYSEGTYVVESSEFSVTARDYHAWPEVYFPDLGWVAFEPTSSQPISVFPSGEAADLNSQAPGNLEQVPTPDYANLGEDRGDEEDLEQALAEARRATRIRMLITYGVGALLMGLFGFAVIRFKRYTLKETPLPTWLERALEERGMKPPAWLHNWSVRIQRSPMEGLFAIIQELLKVWGKPATLEMTPFEQVEILVQTVPQLSEDAQTLLAEYQRSIYSPYPANLDRARRAVLNLRMNGYTLWAQRLVGVKD